MFENDITKTMPCWTCAVYAEKEDDCPILKSLTSGMDTAMEFRQSIKNLSFFCNGKRPMTKALVSGRLKP